MNLKKFYFSIPLILFFKIGSCQEYKVTYKINDTLFVIQKDNSLVSAVVDSKNNFIIPFTNSSFFTWIYFCDSVPVDMGRPLNLFSFPIKPPNNYTNCYTFYIDLNNRCLPTDYFPCPAYTNICFDETPDYLKMIQKGEEYIYNNNIDSAISCGEKAIQLNKSNSFSYYWSANILIGNFLNCSSVNRKINAKNNDDYKNYYNWVKDCLTKAVELEDRDIFKIEILKAMRKFYNYSLNDRKKVKEIKNQIKVLKEKCKNPTY